MDFRWEIYIDFVYTKMAKDASLTILTVIAFVVFHIIVTLPLAWVVTRDVLWPYLSAQDAMGGTPQWVVTLAVFVAMATAFALRAHVIGAKSPV